MATFLVTYHGGPGMPASAEAREQMMAAFQAWAASVGDAMVDPGAPLGPSLGGYTLLRADSLDDAVKTVSDHPFVGRGGTLQVSQVIAP